MGEDGGLAIVEPPLDIEELGRHFSLAAWREVTSCMSAVAVLLTQRSGSEPQLFGFRSRDPMACFWRQMAIRLCRMFEMVS